MRQEIKFILICILLICLKVFDHTTVDWVFILIFIYYGLFSLPEINFKNIVRNIDTLFEERSNLKQQIWELQDKVKELEEKLNK
ncbi:MAG: hypothetical protein KA157_10840 [Aliarcobacter sp.]|nr:hypothetical protein [Aliarcobacter sp.]